MTPHTINQDSTVFTSSFIAEWSGEKASIETYSIIGNNVFGKAIHLYPEPHLRQFEFYYNQDGSIREMDIQFYDLNNTSVPLETKSGYLPKRIKMVSNDEVVDFRSVDNEGEKQWLHNVKRMDFFGGWIPILAQWQWMTNKLKSGKLESNLKFLNYVIGDYNLDLKEKSKNELIFRSDISAPITFYIDNHGVIDSINALGSPWNYKIYKADAINIENFTEEFAKKEVIGDPSPRENFQSKIGNTKISIGYGRPSKRGRVIFGELVPFSQVWRTGAGVPTILTTNSDLNFDGIIIPKGTYNLFTIPTENNWTLIFNTEEGAWGSAHNSDFDFAKIPMKVERISNLIEKFKIDVKASLNGGELIMLWDNTKAYTNFKIDGN
ncbi:DUF2911 domain-containing protein [Urechidicola croceus]|uniref:DUF2911 domain-containing protein n=1 Tax=Urechidicola croceus TaxID=1850246 RepID=A0A1D8P8D3_9FLAO|nr:DUF2911 domain-containing protein [Urechidicola croceus]AOW20833.1 hypothetical protein LPB138_09155 [Urechidicola croceus]